MADKKTEGAAPTALQVYEAGQFPVLNGDGGDFMGALQENMQGQTIRLVDLPKVTVPAGGGLSWQRTDPLSGEVNETRTIEGIPVLLMQQRIYFAKSLDDSGGGTPPDCASVDGITGVGDPGGNCGTCPLAQFGTARTGGGQACSEVARLAVLEPGGGVLPLIINVPTGSLKPIQNFLIGLTNKGIRRSRAVVSFGLEQTTNAGGIKYSVIKPTLKGTLELAEGAAVDSYMQAIAPVLRGDAPRDAPREARTVVIDQVDDGMPQREDAP